MGTSWLSLAFDVAAHTFAVVCIFDGVRRISTFGLSKTAVFSAAFGIIYCIAYAGFNYWTHNFQHESSALLHRGAVVPEFPTDWGTFSPEQRAKTSRDLAQAAFNEHGQLQYHFSEAGKKLLFAPSQTELDQREKKVAQLAQLDYAAGESSDNSARWLFVAVAAAILGFGWSRGLSANTSFKRDALKRAP